jgi:acetyltransferase-like isoleucine patch superfamily enzyme
MSSAGHALRVTLGTVDRTTQRARRAAFLARVRKAAWQVGAKIELDVAADLLVGRDLSVAVEPLSRSVLRIGPRCRLDDRVRLLLRGGELLLGDTVDVRPDVVFSVGGSLRIDGDSPISYGAVFHCSNDIHLERQVSIAEYVTLVDSSHFFTTPDEHLQHNLRKGSVHVGHGSWLCPKVTATRGTDVGAHSIVASNSVVVGPLPGGVLAGGVPAVVLRPLSLPWQP